jgi:hypothetical protein
MLGKKGRKKQPQGRQLGVGDLQTIIQWLELRDSRNARVRKKIDEDLRRRGFSGFGALAACVEKAVSEGRVRKGPVKSFMCTIYDGYWIINKDYAEGAEGVKCLIWLSCAELGVPRELREELIAGVDEFLEGSNR